MPFKITINQEYRPLINDIMRFLTLLVVASLAKTNANAASNETSKLVGKWDLGKYVNIFSQITKIYF